MINRSFAKKNGFTPLNPARPVRLSRNLTGFTLVELLLVISIIGFLIVSVTVIFNIVRMNARDAVRVANMATIKRALALYLNDSITGYPFSIGECLKVDSGVGSDLEAAKVLLGVPVDPLWPTVKPEDIDENGVPDAGQTNFCYFYYSDDSAQYKLSFFLESSSKSGNAGINTVASQ